MSLRTRTLGAVLSLGALGLTLRAHAATWSDGRTTPTLDEIVVIDSTGESNWLYGVEDVAGDGATFDEPERSTDIRTAYAKTDQDDFWFRTYVSSENAVGADVVVFVFLDTDEDDTTGGPANEDVDAAFTEDPTLGGYEFAFAVAGDESIVGVWTWEDGTSSWLLDDTIGAPEAVGEAESDLDPIRIGAPTRGYVQARIDQSLVGLTPACDARLYVRSVNDADPDTSDLDVGLELPCEPADVDIDGIPDVIVPDQECTTDDDCPFDGICITGVCFIAVPCDTADDCDDGFTCTDGRCVAESSGETCEDADDCGFLACIEETCSACTADDDCGDGDRCGSDGVCIDGGAGTGGGGTGGSGFDVDPGDVVRGGPCACKAAGESSSPFGALFGLSIAIIAALRSATRRREGEG
jgi:hypothetical protein